VRLAEWPLRDAMDASSLQRFRRNIYSQNGEDGIVAELLRRLGIAGGWFCEFGAWDGRYGSNCYALLRNKAWSGVMIEGVPARFRLLRRLAAKFGRRLHAVEAFVAHQADSPQTLDRLLAGTPITEDFELLSIDIDGFDHQVWSSLTRYRPKIVIVEINSSIWPGRDCVHGDAGQQGSSFSAMLKLGTAKGYRLVAHTGNMIFVREPYLGALGLPAAELQHPETLFVAEWINPTRLQTWRRKITGMTPQRALVKMQNVLRGDHQ
jgi:hypothetical protein